MTEGAAETESSVTVFVHVHYLEIWEEISVLLERRLTLPFHLVLTSPCPQHQLVLPSTPALLSVRRLPTENRGRDILPFLRALATAHDFDVGLKLHTKKSPQRADGTQWRTAVLNSLLPPHNGVGTIVTHMRVDPRIGFVAPAGFCLSVKPWILLNAEGMSNIMSTKGADLAESDMDDAFFAAGSMFWFRQPAIAGLADSGTLGLFEAEEGQADGTIAHAIERLFPVEARRQGYVSLAVPALTSSQPSMSTTELLDLARRHADMPSAYFPAPYIPAFPAAIGSGASHSSTLLRGLMSSICGRLPMIIRRILRWPLSCRVRGR